MAKWNWGGRKETYQGASPNGDRAGGASPLSPQAVSTEGAHPLRDPEKVVFLDIDGPMIPATMFLIDRMCSWKRRFPETTVAVLNRLCDSTGAKIVFNTTHNNPMRDVPDIEDAIVRAGLPVDHLHPTDLKTRYPSIARDLAIKEWLARHDEVTHWIALDDVICAEKPNMIHVDGDAGLHVGHLNLAVEVLGGEPCIILM